MTILLLYIINWIQFLLGLVLRVQNSIGAVFYSSTFINSGITWGFAVVAFSIPFLFRFKTHFNMIISVDGRFVTFLNPVRLSMENNQSEPTKSGNWDPPEKNSIENYHEGDIKSYEREKRENQIKESEERFRLLVESAPYAIVLTDDEGGIRLINRQTEALFGYERSELIGKPIETLLPTRFRPNHFGYRNSFYYDPQTRPMGVGRDLYGLHKNGFEIPLEIGLTPLRSQDKVMVLSTIVDITERKKNEEKLVLKNEELARYNEELKARTSQLIQSEKMSALGTLIAGVAHELNNPITGILNYAQYCKKNVAPDSKLVGVLDDLLFETKRCAEIVKNLLTYSYFTSAGEHSPTNETANVKEIIKRVCSLFAHLLNDIQLNLDIESDLPEFRIQANKLQQVISNIIKNAIDAMENCSQKEIYIKAYKDSGECHLIIDDTGKGISPPNLSKIFDPFYTTKDVGKGTGLGLSVSRSIIEEYNGNISLESEVGKGTRFHIKFPMN